MRFPSAAECEHVSETQPHNCNAGIPSILKLASKEMMSDSAHLCDTALGFLHIQEIGTNVCAPDTHSTPQEVVRQIFASRSNPSLQLCILSPTKTKLSVVFRWIDCNLSIVRIFLSQAVFHLVTERTSMLTV